MNYYLLMTGKNEEKMPITTIIIIIGMLIVSGDKTVGSSSCPLPDMSTMPCIGKCDNISNSN